MFNKFNRDNALLNLFVSQIKIDFGKELYFVMFFSSKLTLSWFIQKHKSF